MLLLPLRRRYDPEIPRRLAAAGVRFSACAEGHVAAKPRAGDAVLFYSYFYNGTSAYVRPSEGREAASLQHLVRHRTKTTARALQWTRLPCTLVGSSNEGLAD